jgi:hypothetical protein
LEKEGFVRRDEETWDISSTWVWYERTVIESEVTLVLQVEFELSVFDNPFVRTSDNFCYSFNGVYLRIIAPPVDKGNRSSERENILKQPGTLSLEKVLDLFGEEEPREIDRLELRVTTRAQLRSLCRMIWGKTEPVP